MRTTLLACVLSLCLVAPVLAGQLEEGAAVYKPGDEFQDCNTCPKMVVVPLGQFLMGLKGLLGKERERDEGPLHNVHISQAFAVGKFEVTVDQFAVFVRETSHDAGNRCWTYYEDGEWEERSNRNFRNPGFSQGGDHPVACVNWDDAKAYVAWLSKKTTRRYRLLSESEWEYAARAGTTTPFSTGRTITTDQANFNGKYNYNSSRKGTYRKKTVHVGTFAANAFGLHDMHGNVAEWVEDCWNDLTTSAPSDGSARTTGTCGSGLDRLLVHRGGSWVSVARLLRSADRGGNHSDYRSDTIGFRVARTLTP